MTVSDYERQILDSVEEHGWFGTSVLSDTDGAPCFTYSVGFIETLKCPEFIVFGLPAKLAHSMLWIVFRKIRDGAAELGDGRRWSGLLSGHDCISRIVHPSQVIREHFNSALWFARHKGLTSDRVNAFQLFWPGAQQGLFPWEHGCVQEVRDLQPPLYLPRDAGSA